MTIPLRCPACGAPLPAIYTMELNCRACHAVLGITLLAAPAELPRVVIRLLSPGQSIIQTIMAVHDLTGCGHRAAKELAEGPMPVDLRIADPTLDLAAALHRFDAAGARYELLVAPPPPAAPRETATLDPPPPPRGQVLLVYPGPHKINVIKALREVSGLGLADAKDIVDRAPAPFPVKPGVTTAELVALFTRVGARIRVD